MIKFVPDNPKLKIEGEQAYNISDGRPWLYW